MHSLKDLKKLKQKKYRDRWGLFLVEGKRICEEALRSDWPVEAACFSAAFDHDPEAEPFRRMLRNRNIKPEPLTDDQFRKMAETENPQGILLVMRKPSPGKIDKYLDPAFPLVLLLDGIRDPGNMGTIIRSADWFGLNLIISSSDSVDYFNPKTVRSSMGSLFHLHCLEADDISQTVSSLRNNHYTLVATSSQATGTSEDVPSDKPLALILGGEAEGVSDPLQKQADLHLTIPRFGKAESLNVAVAAGILLSQLVPRMSHGKFG